MVTCTCDNWRQGWTSLVEDILYILQLDNIYFIIYYIILPFDKFTKLNQSKRSQLASMEGKGYIVKLLQSR